MWLCGTNYSARWQRSIALSLNSFDCPLCTGPIALSQCTSPHLDARTLITLHASRFIVKSRNIKLISLHYCLHWVWCHFFLVASQAVLSAFIRCFRHSIDKSAFHLPIGHSIICWLRKFKRANSMTNGFYKELVELVAGHCFFTSGHDEMKGELNDRQLNVARFALHFAHHSTYSPLTEAHLITIITLDRDLKATTVTKKLQISSPPGTAAP